MRRYDNYLSIAFLGVSLAILLSAAVTFKLSTPLDVASELNPASFLLNQSERGLKGDVNLFNVQMNADPLIAAPTAEPTGPLGRYLLVGCINSGPQSAAIMQNESADSTVLFKLGERIFGSDEHLARVEYDAVVLARKGGRRRLYLGVLPEEAPAIQERAAPGAAAPPNPGVALSRAEINASVRVAEELLGQSQIMPEVRNNKIVGFKVSNVAENTIVQKMGIKPGDVIKAVNGNQLDSLERSTQIWQQMKQVSEIHMLVEREGKDSIMSFYMKP